MVGQYAEYYLVLRVVAKAVDTANWCPDDNQRSSAKALNTGVGPNVGPHQTVGSFYFRLGLRYYDVKLPSGAKKLYSTWRCQQ